MCEKVSGNTYYICLCLKTFKPLLVHCGQTNTGIAYAELSFEFLQLHQNAKVDTKAKWHLIVHI